jgi:single-stranded DNA-binding protein
MLDPQNLVNISGGVVADPDIINDNILKLRVALDYAGSEKNSDNKSGYFDVVYYLKDQTGFANKNASFVSNQIAEGKMKKGSSVSIIGRLLQERWKQDEKNQSKVVIVAEHITYGQRSNSNGNGNGTAKSSDASVATSSVPATSASIPQSF